MIMDCENQYYRTLNKKTFKCMKCTAYGSIPETQTKCPHCGEELVESELKMCVDGYYLYCSNCLEEQKAVPFCKKCGAKLKNWRDFDYEGIL